MNIFSFNSSDPAVKSLLLWKVGGEEEKWALKAVESLVKKLRKKTNCGTIEDLEYALGNPVRASKCVTIPRSQDGRLQVSHKKNLPHVIYCKLWRWPNIQSHHELKPIPSCQYPYDNRSEHICINPYHYVRVEQQNNPIIFRPQINPSPNEFYRCSPNGGYISPSSSGSESEYSNMFQTQNYLGMHQTDDLFQQQNSPYSTYTSSTTPRQGITASPSAFSDDNDDPDRKSSLNSVQYQRPPDIDDANIWCTISYYELNSRIGEPFKVSSRTVTVDGFTNPSNGQERICLGLLSNVNRNHITENTRRHIGEGVRFECDDDKVVVKNISQSTFFIQSRNANYQQKSQPATVVRVASNSSMIIFDFNLFKNVSLTAYS